jgi:hypothetical protein
MDVNHDILLFDNSNVDMNIVVDVVTGFHEISINNVQFQIVFQLESQPKRRIRYFNGPPEPSLI